MYNCMVHVKLLYKAVDRCRRQTQEDQSLKNLQSVTLLVFPQALSDVLSVSIAAAAQTAFIKAKRL